MFIIKTNNITLYCITNVLIQLIVHSRWHHIGYKKISFPSLREGFIVIVIFILQLLKKVVYLPSL